MTQTTRYSNNDTIDQKLLPSHDPEPSYEYGTEYNHLDYALDPGRSNRTRFEHLPAHRKETLTEYKNLLRELEESFDTHSYQALPHLNPENEVEVLKKATKLARKYEMTFDGLEIPAERHETAFSDPSGLLEAALTQTKHFYERAWDLYANHQSIDQNTAMTSKEAITLTKEIFGNTRPGQHQIADEEKRRNYLTFNQLKADADYVTAAVISRAQEHAREQQEAVWYKPSTWFSSNQESSILRFGDRYGSQQKLLGEGEQRMRSASYAADVIFSETNKRTA